MRDTGSSVTCTTSTCSSGSCRAAVGPGQLAASLKSGRPGGFSHSRHSYARSSPLFASEGTTGDEGGAAADADGEDEAGPVEVEVVGDDGEAKTGFLARIKASMKSQEDDGLTFKQRLAKMGLSALLSYGFVSNMSYSVTVSLAWFGFSKKTGLSPLAPGQWKPFLAVYASFYIFNNFVRPIRLAVSVGVTPYFDRAVAAIQRKTKLNKSASIGIVVFLANFCGTLTAMSLGIFVASIAAGVPVFPPRA